ncbi:MAG: spore germination protein [Ruminococcus sp.]|nr:spore germination protein [Ruminococcus sp.]
MDNKIIKRIQKEFSKNPDLVIKKVKLSLLDTIYIVYLETVSSSDKINDYILKHLSTLSSSKNKKIISINSVIPGPNTVIVNNPDEIEFYITNGFTVVISGKEILAIETKADINRSVSTPDSEPAVNGPKDAFTENYQINLGLIKRRIKTNTLKTDEFVIGRLTKTKIGVLYIDSIADDTLVTSIKEKLEKIDIDGVIDSSNIGQLISDENKVHFPTYVLTERPDNVARALLEGKIVISMDTSPFAIIIPAFFADFINPGVDVYNKSKNVNFLKILRFCCFFLSMMIPAIYIAVVNYNQETIPTNLLVNFSTQHDGVPFPAIVEAFIMLLICEMLRESDIRFPNSYGSAISILGALVLGDAAVSAGIVSPIMIITISLTFMSSLIFTEIEVANTLRHLRFVFIFLASFYGILGIVFGLLYFLIRINDVYSFGKPYFYPLVPFDKTYLFKTLLKKPFKKDRERSPILTDKNYKKLGDNL